MFSRQFLWKKLNASKPYEYPYRPREKVYRKVLLGTLADSNKNSKWDFRMGSSMLVAEGQQYSIEEKSDGIRRYLILIRGRIMEQL